jgi:hypothetical protein
VYLNAKTKRRIPRRTVLFLSIILVVVVVFVTGIVMLLTRGKDIKDTLVQLPCSSTDTYFPVGDNIVYIKSGLLTCVDTSAKDVWKVQLDSSDWAYTSNGSLIAAWKTDGIFIFNSKGENLFGVNIDGSVQSVRLSKNKVAVYTNQVLTDKTLSYIVIFDLSGTSLYKIDISGKYMLDYGFDFAGDQLYILELDVSGTAPLSRISTYRPETQAMTGIKELKDQLVESIYFSKDAVFTMGTNSLAQYSTLNSTAKEVLVYGWVLEDICSEGDQRFVYVPGNANGTYDIARIINSSGDEMRINLPPGVFKILHMGEKIYCFATNSIFVYTGDGKYFRSYELPLAIDGAERAFGGNVFLKAGEMVYLLPLP